MAYKRNLLITNNPVQLVDKSKFANGLVYQGVTITKNSDGSYTLNGTNTGSQVTFNFYKMGANVIPYYLSAAVPIEHNYYTKDCYYDRQYGWLFYILEKGKTYSNLKIYPQIYDLTKTFGVGNEPTTVAAFKTVYPLDFYPYNPSNFVTSYKKHLKVSNVCQLLDKSKYPDSANRSGHIFTNNDDGSITVSGTRNDTSWYKLQDSAIVSNRKYLMQWQQPATTRQSDYKLSLNLLLNDVQTTQADDWGEGLIFNSGKNTRFMLYIDAYSSKPDGDVLFKPQLYDLTEMYGAGNEPTTVEQFRQDFPEEMYPYSPRCWVTSYKTGLIANDSGKVI